MLFVSWGCSMAPSTSWVELCLSCFSACWALPGVGASQLGGKPICFTEPAVSSPPFSSTELGLDLQFNSGVLDELLLFPVKEIISSFPESANTCSCWSECTPLMCLAQWKVKIQKIQISPCPGVWQYFNSNLVRERELLQHQTPKLELRLPSSV